MGLVLEEDADLKLIKASATLLADIENDLPKLLWTRQKGSGGRHRPHSRFRQRDLDHVVALIEPFQGEPQLLDAKLKIILPPIVEAYLVYLSQRSQDHVQELDFETGICRLLYTLCKVRGSKVIVGFLNNEPRYLEPILEALEHMLSLSATQQVQWQVPYVLLLWLSHLLLTPFDLSSISAKTCLSGPPTNSPELLRALPPLAARVVHVGMSYLFTSTNAQDGAAALLVRLCTRPDVQRLQLADALLADLLPKLAESVAANDIYESLGALRFCSRAATATELSYLVPQTYRACEQAFDGQSALASNAVAKKIIVKIFRNVAILSLRSAVSEGNLASFLESTGVLENVIDYLLRSLGETDTPVRYAAAKAISLIVSELEQEMGHEVVQAILDTFKEDLPQTAATMDFLIANPLKWHGLTLTLAHILFKRSASTEQLTDILNALILALQFQQRTTSGSALGTNVRDAANFGIWSLSRRYTTAELLSVEADHLHSSVGTTLGISIIQYLAEQLILSACLDPAGNIRRGSSAALQELVGRHPNQVRDGISLVQIVEYQAVSLRGRAMTDVVNEAATLHFTYWKALLDGLSGWRGLGSPDVASRESAAISTARLASNTPSWEGNNVLRRVADALEKCPSHEVEILHGLELTTALILRELNKFEPGAIPMIKIDLLKTLWKALEVSQSVLNDFNPRMLRSECPRSLARFATELCKITYRTYTSESGDAARRIVSTHVLDALVEQLLTRHEDWILSAIPDLIRALRAPDLMTSTLPQCVNVLNLIDRVSVDSTKSTLHGAGRALALAVLAASSEFSQSRNDEKLAIVRTLGHLISVTNVEWRVIGAKALQLVIDGSSSDRDADPSVADIICMAIHSGLNDYSIDERGDVGSLVRVQCIICARKVLDNPFLLDHQTAVTALKADIYRLSLEKLDRVRLLAAKCREEKLDLATSITDTGSASSIEYFEAALVPLSLDTATWAHRSLLEGCISCAGVSNEGLLQTSRQVLVSILGSIPTWHLERLMTIFSDILKDTVDDLPRTQPALDLLAFLLDTRVVQRLAESVTFKWRNLLSTVQKAHHKSNDIPKILAAVHVYLGLAEFASIRSEVLKKLISMLRTNPYPRVRVAVAEALWAVSKDTRLRTRDWTRPASQHIDCIEALQKSYIKP